MTGGAWLIVFIAFVLNTVSIVQLDRKIGRRIDIVHQRIDTVRRESGLAGYPPEATGGGARGKP